MRPFMHFLCALLYPVAIAFAILRVYLHCISHRSRTVDQSKSMSVQSSLYFVSFHASHVAGRPMNLSDTIYLSAWF